MVFIPLWTDHGPFSTQSWSCPCKYKSKKKNPDAGKDGRQEEKGATEDERLDGTADSMDMSLSRLREMVRTGMLSSYIVQWVRHNWATEQQINNSITA